MTTRQLSLECIAALLIMLFLYASISKFLDFRHFIADMHNQPFPNALTPFLVWMIPCLEILISIALISGRTRLIGLYASLILMILFTIYTSSVLLHFFRYVPCSCGGVIKRLSWRQHMYFNLFFVTLSIIGILLQTKGSKVNPYSSTKNIYV
jgi:putative oxidoreductase